MFSKTIFKQTFKSNWKLWAIFTIAMVALSSVIIAVFDPQKITTIASIVEDIPGSGMFKDTITQMASVLGILSNSFYSMQGVLIPLIFIVMTANSLVAAQVDRGSMAYLLSTPTTRGKVVRTQAAFLILAVFCMVAVVTMAGLFTVQIFQGGVFSPAYTQDVKAVSKELNLEKETVADDLSIILKDSDALRVGADARRIDEDVYTIYLNLKTMDNVYKAAADVMDVDSEEISDNPALIKDNSDALTAAAKVLDMQPAAFSTYLDGIIAQKEAASEQTKQLQTQLFAGINAAADTLGMESDDLLTDMGLLKSNDEAMDSAVSASGIPEQMLVTIINQQLAADELGLDDGIEFKVKDYILLNIGLFLLMFATSGVSFMFSCIFNLSKNSLALGAGLPAAFFIFELMAQVDDSLDWFKYLTINTLFDPSGIINGSSYWLQFGVLLVMGVALYIVGIKVFQEKDLPL